MEELKIFHYLQKDLFRDLPNVPVHYLSVLCGWGPPYRLNESATHLTVHIRSPPRSDGWDLSFSTVARLDPRGPHQERIRGPPARCLFLYPKPCKRRVDGDSWRLPVRRKGGARTVRWRRPCHPRCTRTEILNGAGRTVRPAVRVGGRRRSTARGQQ